MIPVRPKTIRIRSKIRMATIKRRKATTLRLLDHQGKTSFLVPGVTQQHTHHFVVAWFQPESRWWTASSGALPKTAAYVAWESMMPSTKRPIVNPSVRSAGIPVIPGSYTATKRPRTVGARYCWSRTATKSSKTSFVAELIWRGDLLFLQYLRWKNKEEKSDWCSTMEVQFLFALQN